MTEGASDPRRRGRVERSAGVRRVGVHRSTLPAADRPPRLIFRAARFVLSTVRRVVLSEIGGPEVLRFESVPTPSPGPGEVLVRHEAVGVNFIDLYHRSGLYPLPLPSGLGLEAAGTIEAVGAGVAGLRVGDPVAYATGPVGAYAEARTVDARHVVRRPEGIDAKTAAASLLRGMTAEFLLRRAARIEAGDWVVLHAAAGGVGLIAAEWLVHLGANVIATVGTDEKAEVVRALGVEHVVNYAREDFVERARALTGGVGVRVVYDSVGRDTFERSLDCLARRGTLVAYGNASGRPPALDPLRLARGSLFLTRPTLFDYTATRAELELSSGTYFEALRAGHVHLRPPRELPLAAVAEAHRALAARETIGSLVLVP